MPGLEGTSLGRYRLQRRLGRGGMAEVYLASDERMGREVAIKVVNSNQAEFAERFDREAKITGNLPHHDHLLPAYDRGEQEPWHYLVMPYVENGTLADLLKRGPLPLKHAGELLQQIASCLQYAHKNGLVHRDIKPSNILLRDDHYAYLADFGLARKVEGTEDLTQTGTLLGTPEYMAPELSDGPAGVSSDVYALAIVLYQMVSGRVPFRGDTAISTYWKHIREEPQKPSQYNPSVPPEVDRVLIRALQKDPELRYPTPLALSQAYQEAIRGLEDMPALYDTEAVEIAPARSSTRQEPPPVAPVQPEKLILPGERVPRIPPEARRMQPPIVPARNFEQTIDMVAPNHQAPPPVRQPRPRRRRGSRAIAGIIMGVGFLLIVSGILAYLTITARQQQGVSATATANTDSTNSAVTSLTQQAQGTQQAARAATAIAAGSTAQAQSAQRDAEATATAITSVPPALSDPLTGPDSNWPDNSNSCTFQNNAYFVTSESTSFLQLCISNTLQYGNGAFQVDVTPISAADTGLIFRASPDGKQFYDFEITGQQQFFLRYQDNGKFTSLIPNTSSSAIRGAGEKNTLLIIANGSNFQLFINNTFVGAVQDSTFTSGQLGFAAGTSSLDRGDASFANLSIYAVH